MKIGLFLSALVALGGLAATPGYALPHPAMAKPVATPATTVSPGSRRGSIGGPASKGAGINGTLIRRKH